MYDYATDKYVPVRFFDYVQKTWSTEKPATTLEIQEGEYAPSVGLTYFQIGREGLSFQKSQNNGVAIPPPGPQASAYHRYGSLVPAAQHEESFFDGVDVSVSGIASLVAQPPDSLKNGLAEIARVAGQAEAQFQTDRPFTIAPLLAEGLRTTRALIQQVEASSLAQPGKSDVVYELRVKEEQFSHALTESLGLTLRAAVMPDREPSNPGPFPQILPTFTVAIPGQSFGVAVDLLNQSPETATIEQVAVAASDGKAWGSRFRYSGPWPKAIGMGERAQFNFGVTVAEDAPSTRPYFPAPMRNKVTTI